MYKTAKQNIENNNIFAMCSQVVLRSFSGIQPTGVVHLGNYVGAVRRWATELAAADAKDRRQRLYSVVDLHAITMPQRPDVLRANVNKMAATLVACGVQPEK